MADKDFKFKPSRLSDDETRYITPGLEWDAKGATARLPDLRNLQALSNAELIQTMNYYGAIEPLEAMRAQSMQYVTRMTSYRPGSKAWSDAVEDLMDTSSRRNLVGMNRRIAQQWTTLTAIDGDVTKELMAICEDDESSCEECISLQGMSMQFREWKEYGEPSEHCRGGNSCRCDLVVVE